MTVETGAPLQRPKAKVLCKRTAVCDKALRDQGSGRPVSRTFGRSEAIFSACPTGGRLDRLVARNNTKMCSPHWKYSTIYFSVAVLVCGSSLCTGKGSFWSSKQHPVFASVPALTADKGRGKVAELQQLATGESFINKLLGTDCFSNSLRLLDSDCAKMDADRKSRLAMALANCHLEQLGLPTFTCKPNMNLRQCADSMQNDRQYSTYLEFLSNIDTMCLFLQSQDFQRHTELMINSLYGSAQHADENLRNINSKLHKSLDTMSDLDSSLSSVAAAQQQQQQLAEAGLKGIQQLHDDAQTVQTHLSHVLQHEAQVLARQDQVLTNLASLDDQEAARAEGAAARWQEAQDQAAALLEQQQQYQAVQDQLLGDLRTLSDNSAGLRSALDVVVQYEQQGAVMLTRMLGTSYGAQDLLTYLLAAVAILGCGLSKATKGAQLPLLLLAVTSLVAERMLMHSFADHLDVDPTGQVVMHLPVPGLTFSPKTAIRRLCIFSSLLCVCWTMWKHVDSEQEALRMLRKLTEQSHAQRAEHNEALKQIQHYIAAVAECGPQISPQSRCAPTTPAAAPNITPSNSSRSQRLGQARGHGQTPSMLLLDEADHDIHVSNGRQTVHHGQLEAAPKSEAVREDATGTQEPYLDEANKTRSRQACKATARPEDADDSNSQQVPDEEDEYWHSKPSQAQARQPQCKNGSATQQASKRDSSRQSASRQPSKASSKRHRDNEQTELHSSAPKRRAGQ